VVKSSLVFFTFPFFMTMSITFQSLESLAPEVLNFWREQQAFQDPWKGLTGTPEWFSMMSAGSAKPAVVAVASDAEGAVVAVLPLLFQFMDFGAKRALVARVCGGDLVLQSPQAEDQRPTISSLWAAIISHDHDIQAIILDHVDQSRLSIVQASCERDFFLHARSKLMPHYRLILPQTYNVFRALRSASSLKKIEGRERAMVREAGGECRLTEIRQPADWAPYAIDINRLMNATWQAKRLGHGFDIESCRETSERGWLRSFLLLVGDKPVAFVLGYQAPAAQGKGELLSCPVDKLLSESPKGTLSSATQQPSNLTISHRASGAVFHYEQIGHDAAFAKYSPGTTLLYRLIQRLYEIDTPGCVDFGEGEAEYKKTLANQITYAQSVLVVRNRLRWRVRFGLVELVRWVRESARTMAEKWGVRRRIAKFLKYRA
jgi:CelD/BcsL family acetyltransferase involved in cellulose biosynthesis